jgi:hypothetical protein
VITLYHKKADLKNREAYIGDIGSFILLAMVYSPDISRIAPTMGFSDREAGILTDWWNSENLWQLE